MSDAALGLIKQVAHEVTLLALEGKGRGWWGPAKGGTHKGKSGKSTPSGTRTIASGTLFIPRPDSRPRAAHGSLMSMLPRAGTIRSLTDPMWCSWLIGAETEQR